MNVSGVKVPFSLLSTNLTGQDLYTGGVLGLRAVSWFYVWFSYLQLLCSKELVEKN